MFIVVRVGDNVPESRRVGASPEPEPAAQEADRGGQAGSEHARGEYSAMEDSERGIKMGVGQIDF